MSAPRRRRTIIRGVPVTRDALALYIGRIESVRWEGVEALRVRVTPEDPKALDRLDRPGVGFGNFWASADVEGQHIRVGMLHPRVHGDNWSDFVFESPGASTWTTGDHLWAERVR